MAGSIPRFSQFRTDIRKLVAEIRQHARTQQDDQNREYRLQYEAFEERCDQAKQLAEEISVDERRHWQQRDGDARRVENSLRLSLDYFRGQES